MTQYNCEWCQPSDIPALLPTVCRVKFCKRHRRETWHWPAYPDKSFGAEKVAEARKKDPNQVVPDW